MDARSRALGPEHPDTLVTRNNLARWTGKAGNPAAARDQAVLALCFAATACAASRERCTSKFVTLWPSRSASLDGIAYSR